MLSTELLGQRKPRTKASKKIGKPTSMPIRRHGEEVAADA
jgi:hypothetical protein